MEQSLGEGGHGTVIFLEVSEEVGFILEQLFQGSPHLIGVNTP